MKYKCELIVKNKIQIHGISGGYFELALKYKKENDLFYKKEVICYYGMFCDEYQNNIEKYHSFKEFVTMRLQKFSNMSNDNFIQFIKRIIMEKEEINDGLTEEITKLKQLSKNVFEIEI